MKRTVKVLADDGMTRIEATIRIMVPKGDFVRGEVESIVQKTARGYADVLKQIPYTDFGVENTRVAM